MVIDLLQQVGLTKYEAEAYVTLLREGPLTGYELGKRSQVPLPRSYDVLERLVQRGLALVQPGDPPRYRAEELERFLAQTRSRTLATLDAIATDLAEVARPAEDDGFWVVRGRDRLLDRANSMILEAQDSVLVSADRAAQMLLAGAINEARRRGIEVVVVAQESGFALIADGKEALVGALQPVDSCQGVLTHNAGLLALAQSILAGRKEVAAPGWLAFEDEKQRGLLHLVRRGDVA